MRAPDAPVAWGPASLAFSLARGLHTSRDQPGRTSTGRSKLTWTTKGATLVMRRREDFAQGDVFSVLVELEACEQPEQADQGMPIVDPDGFATQVKDFINSVSPDSFDCGLRCTGTSATLDADGVRVVIDVEYTTRDGEEMADSAHLTWADAALGDSGLLHPDLVTAIMEAVGAVLDLD
jgi:hypothetical protein